jgi:hypothetical protein
MHSNGGGAAELLVEVAEQPERLAIDSGISNNTILIVFSTSMDG